jgi:hypothetical protein
MTIIWILAAKIGLIPRGMFMQHMSTTTTRTLPWAYSSKQQNNATKVKAFTVHVKRRYNCRQYGSPFLVKNPIAMGKKCSVVSNELGKGG